MWSTKNRNLEAIKKLQPVSGSPCSPLWSASPKNTAIHAPSQQPTTHPSKEPTVFSYSRLQNTVTDIHLEKPMVSKLIILLYTKVYSDGKADIN